MQPKGSQFNQLTMFEPAGSLRSRAVNPAELERVPDENSYHFLRDETPDEMWSRKSSEAGDRGIANSIAERGVHRPVVLHGGSQFPSGMIQDGYHRTAVAAEVNPKSEVPVTWRDQSHGGSPMSQQPKWGRSV